MTGYCLAMAVYMSDGLPSVSLPKSQGITDLILPMMKRNGSCELSPLQLNPYALHGAMVVNPNVLN